MSLQNSSTIVTGVNAPALPQHEWDVTGWIPDKPAGLDYGYVVDGQTIGSTREQLIETLVQRGSQISFVWTTDTPEPVRPEQVPVLVAAFHRIQIKEARTAILWSVGLVAFGVVLALGFQDWTFLYHNIFFVFGAVGLVEGIWKFKRSRNYTQEDAVSDASAARFATWIKDRNLSGYTTILMACIVVVTVVQAFVEDSIALTGLVKPAVWRGEVWRLFTATLMHANLTHFWMNALGLIYVSKIIEHTMQRAYVPLVFLVTGAIGSVFSVVLYPHTTSVGASGGIMGLLGFITIAAYLDRKKYPPKYFRQMIEGIVVVGAFGLFGFAFIDNAAHLGGVAGGLLLGYLWLRRNEPAESTEGFSRFGGLVALVVLGFIAAFAVYRMAL